MCGLPAFLYGLDKGVVRLINKQALDEAIYEKYIRPIQRPRRLYAGLEFELPVVNLAQKPVDFKVIYALTDAYRHGRKPLSRAQQGHPHRQRALPYAAAPFTVLYQIRQRDPLSQYAQFRSVLRRFSGAARRSGGHGSGYAQCLCQASPAPSGD